MLVYIDHYDSFSDILVDYFKQLGEEVVIFRTDEVSLKIIEELSPDYIVIGPGPGHPNDSSLSEIYHILRYLYAKLPILGICLGHQIICQFFGAKIKRLEVVHHGVISKLIDTSGKIFSNIDNEIEVTRYHSLVANSVNFPECLRITSACHEANAKIIMGVEHVQYPIYGLQFHPEAIKTSYGLKMLENFLKTKKSS